MLTSSLKNTGSVTCKEPLVGQSRRAWARGGGGGGKEAQDAEALADMVRYGLLMRSTELMRGGCRNGHFDALQIQREYD